MFKFFSSDFFHFEFLRLIGVAAFECSEVGECLEAAQKIKVDDAESWYETWRALAERVENIGEEALKAGHKDAARWAFLRASNYFRASEFMTHHAVNDNRQLPSIERSVKNFRRGIKLLDSDVHFLEIPYENGHTLPAYLYMPPESRRLPGKIPILVGSGGFDSIQEELYPYIAAGAITRGYAALTFEGPGQGIVLRKDKLPMRPDWEKVTERVLDHLFEYSGKRPELDLDLDRIAIAGASMGGHFALRCASFDRRFKACISLDGFYDMFDIVKSRTPGWFLNGWLKGYFGDGFFNGVFAFLSKANFQTKWEFGHAMLAFNVPSPADVIREFAKYTLRDGTHERLQDIQCPVMLTGAEDSLYAPPAVSEKMYETLVQLDPLQKHLWIGTGVGEGGLQAKVSALGISHQKMFSWLDLQFGIRRDGILA